jgi:Uma2 family endonuclease
MAAIAQPPPKTWTRAELEALEAAGLLEGTRLELIDGEVFTKRARTRRMRLQSENLRLLSARFSAEHVGTQVPVEPAEAEAQQSLPEPDVVVTREPASAFRHRHPGASDVLLVAEVSDTTYDHDAKRKAKLYARAGYSEYILLDLNERELVVFQSPRRVFYTEIHVLRSGDEYRPLCAPDSAIQVAQLLGD